MAVGSVKLSICAVLYNMHIAEPWRTLKTLVEPATILHKFVRSFMVFSWEKVVENIDF